MFPVVEPPIENGIVEVRDGRIVSLGKGPHSSHRIVDLGEVALVPGWVNAHTHLEFSCLSKPLGQRGMPFAQWIGLVVANRMTAGDSDSRNNAIAQGLKEAHLMGTTVIGEIATDPVDLAHYATAIQCTVFLERLGRSPDHWLPRAESARHWLGTQRQDSSPNPILEMGLSPHAPFSVHPQLLDQLIKQSQSFGCPVAMHLAESKEELQLVDEQTGPFVDVLKSLGAWFPESYARGTQMIDYLKALSQVERTLVIHGNYLCPKDINFLAQQRHRMSVVYCPRTHDYFEHEPYPLVQLLKAGINVAVGTDSRASNPDLSVFKELQTIRRKFEAISSDEILKMGTTGGARALGRSLAHSSIAVGQEAHLNVLTATHPEHLFDPQTQCVPLQRYRVTTENG